MKWTVYQNFNLKVVAWFETGLFHHIGSVDK